MVFDNNAEEKQQLQINDSQVNTSTDTDTDTNNIKSIIKTTPYRIITLILIATIILTLVINFPYQIVLTYKINSYVECTQQGLGCLDIVTGPTYECNTYNQTCPNGFECMYICWQNCTLPPPNAYNTICPDYMPLTTYDANYGSNQDGFDKLKCISSSIQCAYHPPNWNSDSYTVACNGYTVNDLITFGSSWYYYYVTSYIILLSTSLLFCVALFSKKFVAAVVIGITCIINFIILIIVDLAYTLLINTSNIMVCTNIYEFIPILNNTSWIVFIIIFVRVFIDLFFVIYMTCCVFLTFGLADLQKKKV